VRYREKITDNRYCPAALKSRGQFFREMKCGAARASRNSETEDFRMARSFKYTLAYLSMGLDAVNLCKVRLPL